MAAEAGFGLAEVLVATAVFGILLAAALIITQQAIEAIGEIHIRAAATVLARDQIELAHNVTYEDLGTVGGIPAGTLPATVQKVVNGLEYTIRTFVVYVDDPFDGEAPTDVVPADYKRVRVEVSWEGVLGNNKPVVLWTDIAPKGLETLPGTGVLLIRVFDAQAIAVESAEVRVPAPTLVPPVDILTYSDANGRVLLPGAPVCDSCYRVSATKAGYTSSRTYSTAEVANPDKPDLSVLEAGISEVSLAIDRPSSVTFRVTRGAANNYTPFAGVQLSIRGSKIIGTTATDDSVYLHSAMVTVTGAQAQAVVTGLEWDSYHVSLPGGSSVDFAGSWPLTPFVVAPNSNQTVLVVVEAASANSLHVTALDLTSQPLASGSATLVNTSTGVIATKSAGLAGRGDWSQMFFPNLSAGMYDLSLLSLGYQTATASVSVLGDTKELFLLSP